MKPCYGYATHLPALIDAIIKTSGPVLELGSGKYSTPILHQLCCTWPDVPRHLVTVETDPTWFDLAVQHRNEHHLVVSSFEAIELDNHWSVVFIDCELKERVKHLEQLKDRATFLVLHDTSCVSYGYEKAVIGMKFARVWSDYQPWTTVVSNERRP